MTGGRFNIHLHRALGSVLDAAMHINALQHSDAVNPGNIPANLEAAKQALQGALLDLATYQGRGVVTGSELTSE